MGRGGQVGFRISLTTLIYIIDGNWIDVYHTITVML